MELKNIKRYYPDEMPLGDDVQYFIDDKGRDWFKSLKCFKKPYAISYDEQTQLIHSCSTDASAIFPAGLSVVDIDSLPDNFDIADNWLYQNGQIVRNFVMQAESLRQTLLEEAGTTVADWMTDLQLGIISDDDRLSLIAWREYIKSLKAMDLTIVADEAAFNALNWPAKP